MDDGCGLGSLDWSCYYDLPRCKSHLGLQLMSPVGVDRSTKGLLGGGALVNRELGVMPMHPSAPVDFARSSWIQQGDKFMNMFPLHQHNYGFISDNHVNLQMVPHQQQQMDVPEDDKQIALIGENGDGKDLPSKKRSAASKAGKAPKPKKPKKAKPPKEESYSGAISCGKPVRKTVSMVINGMNLDISALPAPVCTCTGVPHQCYRWGAGGWQSACCTTTLSIFPLPMSQKRRGARIAGRKMSLGAFKKVLEKLIHEGYDLSDPIDLRSYWAKHGTNKFVTIR